MVPTRLEGKVDKGWGYELIWATNEQYCGKIMVFEKVGAKFSMHFHKEKDETWFVNNGRFLLNYIDTDTAEYKSKELTEGMTWRNPPLMPHQLVCMEPGSSVTEVSTPDSVEDNYRIAPGDSQKSKPQIETASPEDDADNSVTTTP
jgi:mannose-6-phosphate isomerase-like protein (cupin superfamily)|tara:strand:- start:136 stop:573 length:438 start_codon:yes stop_codon:yes gene_type:complete